MFKTMLAFGCVYFVWGSTYLAVLVGLESLPPFLLSGVRFLVAGSVLYLWERLRGEGAPTSKQWATATKVGTLMLVTGAGAVAWAEQWVSSGLAALLISTVPLWVVLLEWLDGTARRPGATVVAGLVLGLIGVAVLVGATAQGGSLGGILVVLLAALSWSWGTLMARGRDLPDSAALATSMKMVWAGLVFCFLSLGAGERVANLSSRSVWALVYLTLFGSVVAFSAYVWLVRKCGASRVSTYAYVNPVVAVFLGWALGGETLGGGALLGAGLILAAVFLIVTGRGSGRHPAKGTELKQTLPPGISRSKRKSSRRLSAA